MKNLIFAVLGFFIFCAPAIAQTTQASTVVIYRPSIAMQSGRGVNTSITNGTATTQQTLDNSTFIASDAFASNLVIRARSVHPLAITGGTYNFASLGSGLSVVTLASGGTVTSFLAIANPGSGYAVGDVVQLSSGNRDAYAIVNTIGSGGTVPATADLTMLYGGSGYVTGGSTVTQNPQINSGNTFTLTGALTSNALFILQSGTYISSSTQLIINNNTTGAYTVQFMTSNGADGSIGTGVYIPQGTNNSCATFIQKDGVNDIWLAAPSVCSVAPAYISGTTASLGGSALIAGQCMGTDTSVAGATTSNVIVVTPTADPGSGIWWNAFVPTAGTVRVRICAAVAMTPTAETYNFRVLQ